MSNQTYRSAAAENKQNDLLGLHNGDDNFTGFLSAPTKEEKKTEEADASKSEEESFFNQTAPLEKEKVKLTKDSILALYGNTPTNNFAYQNSVGQVPYQTNFPGQNAFQNVNAFAPTGFPAQNGLQYPINSNIPIAGQQFAASQWGATPQANVAFMQNPMQTAGPNQFPVGGQFSAAPQFSASFQPGAGVQQFGPLPQNASFTQTPNPFSTVQANTLPQQFGNMSLNNPTNGTSTLATNLWQ